MGISWTNELIEEKLMVVAKLYSPMRMPTRSEIKNYYGNDALTNKISKTGGFSYWAKKLGLEQKHSETSIGIKGEERVAEILLNYGFEVEKTSTKHPYDLLIDGCVKVDVKTANTSYIRGSSIHAYRIAKKQHTCDFYVFYENDTGKAYVVPAHKCKGQIQVEIGNNSRKYEEYLYAYRLIDSASQMFRSL